MKAMTEDHLAVLRRHMVEMIDIHFDVASDETGRGAPSSRVREAMLAVPRHLFVPPRLALLSYHDTPLPIGFDKTVSQPFIAALMLDLLDVRPGQRVLEIGTGLGYQAALMSAMGARVWSVEIVEEFAQAARLRLAERDHDVEIRVGDGSRGWSDHAPFDRILLTAAARELPAALTDQLGLGGRLVAPLGDEAVQHLSLVTKSDDGALTTLAVMPVRFTKLETL